MQPSGQRLYQIARKKLPPPLTARQIFLKKLQAGFLKFIFMFRSTHPWWSIYRTILSNILPDNILYRWQPYRQGECNRCGACCKILFHCPFYVETEKGGHCSIYNTPYAMKACLNFPVNPGDLAEIQRAIAPTVCAFSFEGSPGRVRMIDLAKGYSQAFTKGPKEATDTQTQ